MGFSSFFLGYVTGAGFLEAPDISPRAFLIGATDKETEYSRSILVQPHVTIGGQRRVLPSAPDNVNLLGQPIRWEEEGVETLRLLPDLLGN